MNLKGKASSMALQNVKGFDWPEEHREDMIVNTRWLEDEIGRKQLIQQNFEFLVLDKDAKLAPNQEKVKDLPWAGNVQLVRYVVQQISLRNDKWDGPEIRFDEKGNVIAIRHFRNGKRDGMVAERTPKGWKYNLYSDGELIKNDWELKTEWAERQEATKFEKLVKGGGIKGLKTTLKKGENTPVASKDKTR